jgi:hypothetical protein
MGIPGKTTRVTIDVDIGSEPISGQVELDGRRTTAFVGWSALTELIEEARTRPRPDGEHRRKREEPTGRAGRAPT